MALSLLLLASHLDLLQPCSFKQSCIEWQECSCPLVYMRGTDSLLLEKMSCLIHYLQLSLVVEGPCPLPIFLAFVQLEAGQSSWVLIIHFMSQHSLVFGIKTFIDVITLHLFYMLLLHPSQVLQLEHLDLMGKTNTEISYILIQSLLERIEFLTEGIECHYDTIVFI